MIPIIFRRGRRRQFIVDRKFQLGYALTGVVYIAAVTLCLVLPFLPILNTLHALLDGQPANIVETALKQERMGLVTYLLCATWLAAAWVLFSIFRSHKIAGPSYKLKRFLDDIVPGKFDARVTLRSGDQLGSIATALNGLMEKLQTRDEQIEQRIERLGRQSGEDPAELARFILDGQEMSARSRPSLSTKDPAHVR